MGYDAGKRVKGRKIHALVDTEGLPMRVVVHSAGLQDCDGAALVLARIRGRFPWLQLVFADAGYDARQVKAAVAAVPVLRMEIIRRSDDVKGFRVQPRRWVVERTFSWIGRNRRLAKDYEGIVATLAALVTLAAIRIALRRLARIFESGSKRISCLVGAQWGYGVEFWSAVCQAIKASLKTLAPNAPFSSVRTARRLFS